MRAMRENTYGVPTRILTNANCGLIIQAAYDHDAAHHEPLRHAHWATCRYCETHLHSSRRACRAGWPCAADLGVQVAGVAPHPCPRWPRPPAEHAVRVRPQVADHAQR